MSDFLTRVRTIRPDLAGVSDSELSGLLGLPYEEPARSFPRAVGDAATKLIGGVPKAAAGLVGLGSFVPGVHYAADPLAEGLNNAGNWVEDQLLSDVQKRKDQELSRVLQGQEGFWDDAKAAGSYLWDNPSQAAMTAIGSIPSMIAGGIAGKGIRGGLAAFGAKPISAATAAAAGEGAVIAGSVGSEIAARNPEDFAARYYGIPAGLAGAAIGRAGAKVMGGSDIDTMIVNGMTREALEAGGPLNLLQSLPKRVGLGVVGEGLVEEAPQSAVERMMTNLGVEDPMMQGVGAEAVIGGAAGGIMGGAAGLRRPGGTYTMQERDQALQVLSDPTASYGARVQAAEYLQRIQDDGRPRDLLNMQQEAEEQFVEQSATELADQIRAERMPSTEPEFQWQQPGQTKEDVAAAFDEVVGTVGDKPVTAWDAYKAAHPEIFAKQEKAPKEKKLSKRQQEMNTLMAEAAQAGATEQDMQLLEGMVKDFKLPELRKTVAQIKAARAETPNVPPPDPVEAVQRRAEAVQPDTAEPQEVTARQVLEGLIAKIPGKIQQRDVGQYFGLLTGVETDTAVMAERRGVSRQAANDSLKRGLASLRKIAEKSGVSLEALQRQISEENDTGLTVSQQEILDATQTSTLDDGDLGTSLTVKDNTKKSFGETRRYIDPEQAYRETMLRTNGDPNQANLARARAQANNAELARLDAAEGPLEEPIVGQTLTPTYEHSAEDVAKAKQLWEELQAENGWVAWEVLSQEDKDSYTQMTRDILVGVMPNYSRLDKHADYLSEKYDGDSRQPERRTESPDDGARGPDLQEVQAANGEPDSQQGGDPAETEEVVQGDDRQGARGEISADLIEAEWDKGAKALGLPQWSRLFYSQRNYMLGSGTWQEFDEAAAEIAEDLTTGRIPADEAGFVAKVGAGETARQAAPDYSEMSPEELGKLWEAAVEHNRRIENALVREWSPEIAQDFESWGQRKRDKWLDANLTVEQEEALQRSYQDEETIREFSNAATNFATESPTALGRSIAIVARDIDKPGFFSTPEGATVKAAMRFAEVRGWNLDTVLNGMRARAVEWAGEDAKELFGRYFKKVTPDRIPADEAGFTTGQLLESQVSGRTKNPSTEKDVLAALYELAGVDATAKNAVPWNKQRLAVYGTLSEVPENLRHLFTDNNTQGVAWEGIRAVILAERVEKGTERGVLLHEVGAHVGLTELIGEKNVIEVANQIERMGKGGSRIEQEAVAAAQARIPQDTPQGDRVQELIGYTAEELDKRGIRPQGQGMGSQLLRKIMALVRTALNKLGLFQVSTEAFTGQDLMDLLQGSMANVMQGQRQFTTPPLNSVLKSGNVRPLWYSRAAEHVLKKGPGKATAVVWMSNLNSWAKSGAIKQDELQWSGVENWLKGQEGTLSRDDVARFFNEGGVQVEEKVLGGGSTWLVYERGSGNVLAEGFNTESDAENWATENIGDGYRVKEVRGEGSTHYSFYTEPGAKEGSYREILLKLPGKGDPRKEFGAEYEETVARLNELTQQAEALRTQYSSDLGTNRIPDGVRNMLRRLDDRIEELAAEKKRMDAVKAPPLHQAPHYGNENENILATARINERTDAEGNRVLYVEEIQSDWAQDLRKNGMVDQVERDAISAELEKLGLVANPMNLNIRALEQVGASEELIARFDKEFLRGYNKASGAPFVGKTEQWAGLILKRLMRYAADNGFDKVAWSTGEQQFKRWGSERVSWKKGEVSANQKSMLEDEARIMRNAIANTEKVISDWETSLAGIQGLDGNFDAAIKFVQDALDAENARLKEYQERLQKAETSLKGGAFVVAATEQHGGNVDGTDIEELARARGELLEQSGQIVQTKEDLRKILRETMRRENNEQQVDAMTDKLWSRMQKEPEGDFMPRREGMRGFYGDEQGRAPDGKPSWLANALKALPAEIRPKLETIGVKMRQAESGPAAAWNFLDQAIGQPGFTVDKALANTPMPLYSKTAANVVESFKTGSGDRWAKLKPYLLSLQQMNDQYGTKIKSMPAYTRTVGAMEQLQQQITMEAHPIIVKWQSLDAGVRDRLHKLMKEATLSGAHPDVAFDDPLNAHLSDKAKATHDKLRAQYTALPMEAKGIYQQSKGQLQKLWKQRGDFYTALVNHSYAKLIENQPEQKAKLEKKRDKLIAEHQAKLKELKGPYFPLLRFGDYIVVGKSKAYLDLETSLDGLEGQEYKDAAAKLAGMKKDAKHYSVWATESLNLANQKMRELQGQGLQVKQPRLAEEHSSALSPVSAYSMQRINTVLNNQLDAGTANKVERLLTELYLTSLPEHSALQRQIKRIGVEGANDNMLRTFARAIQADSFHLSRMKYGTELSSLLFQMEKEAKDAGTEAQHAMRVIKKSLDLDMEYKPHPVLGLIQKFTSFMMLGVSPAYLFTNASQPWMIALPQIAGVHGFNNTLKAMSAAWGDAKNAIVASKKKGAFADIDFNAIKDANERQMLQFIRDNGQVDITINFDTGIAAEDSDPRIARAERVAAWANHHIEVSNRITTALTAYRLAKQSGQSHDKATEYAYKQVVDTQLDYSNANAAYFMKGQHFSGLNRLIMQFKKYQQGMLYLLAHNAQQAFKGDRQAMASLGYLMAMQVSFAGLAGVPLMFPLLMLVPGGGDDEGDNETRFRNMLTDAFGKDVADAMYKGLPTMLGMDLSKRLGLGELLDPTPFYDIKDIKREKTGKDAVGNLALSLAGPAAGMTSNYFDAGFLGFRDGEWGKAFEKALPKALSDPLKATRYAETGITTRKGNVALEADKLSTWDLWQRGLGFTSAKESNYYEAVQAKEDTKAALEARRSRLITNWANYKLRGDTEAVAEMEQAVKNWNAKHPEKGVRIDRSTLLKSVQQRRKDAAQRNEAGVLLKKNEQHLRDVTRFAAAP